MGGYLPGTEQERRDMLTALGLSSADELFSALPESVRLKSLSLPEGLSQQGVERRVRALAAENPVYPTVLRGAGAERHFIPAIVDEIASREVFVTAYTPYQPEISQGVLQSIFEYQSMVCDLYDMDVANASVYDGASAAAEAAAMCRERTRVRVLVSGAVNPRYAETVKTYAAGRPVEELPLVDGRTDASALKKQLGADVACVLVQQPNYFGLLEDLSALTEIAHAAGAKLAVVYHPLAAALFRTPGECGCDIAVGEGQPLGLPMSYGGPYLGMMAARKALMRKLPGRIVGETTDRDGRRAFVLTLQAREQHIRREKASSSVCSNEALCALRAGAYLAAMGPKGLRNAATQCYSKAHYLADRLAEAGLARAHTGEFFHEFVTKCEQPETLLAALSKNGILGGLPVEGGLLWCVTESNTREELDRAAAIAKEVRA